MPTLHGELRAARGRTGAGFGIGREVAEGLTFVLHRPVLRGVFGSLGVFVLSQGVINVLRVVLVSELWGGGVQKLRWLITAQRVGSLAGARRLAAWRRASALGR